MLERKQPRFTGANKPWSTTTRARISRFLFLRTIFSWRNWNQRVAAGPKMAARKEA